MIRCLSMMIASTLMMRVQVQNSTLEGRLSRGFAQQIAGSVSRRRRGCWRATWRRRPGRHGQAGLHRRIVVEHPRIIAIAHQAIDGIDLLIDNAWWRCEAIRRVAYVITAAPTALELGLV